MSEWINVKDRLPTEGELVLTFHGSGPWSEYFLDYTVEIGKDIIWAKTLQDDWHKISHWMPLPESPK